MHSPSFFFGFIFLLVVMIILDSAARPFIRKHGLKTSFFWGMGQNLLSLYKLTSSEVSQEVRTKAKSYLISLIFIYVLLILMLVFSF